MTAPDADPIARIFHNGIGWNYSIPGVAMTDRCYRTKRMAMAAAKRAIKRRNERDREAPGTGGYPDPGELAEDRWNETHGDRY